MERKVIRYLIIFIDLIFVLIAGINIMELVDILVYKEFYPFGTEFFSPYSIYKSKEIYVTFKTVLTISIVIMVIFSVLKLKRPFWLLVIINTCLALYAYLSI